MRFSHFACLVISLMLLSPISSASELVGGQDENPTPDEVPFTIVARDAPSIDGETWALTLEMNEEEHANGTVFEITTQICTNDGVCDPPVLMEMTVNEREHLIDLKPKDDHTYINWRVKATYEDGGTQHGHRAGNMMVHMAGLTPMRRRTVAGRMKTRLGLVCWSPSLDW